MAAEVWAALGDVDNYVEPFAGSLACLLERPRWHSGQAETVNDADCMIANFWRALAADPVAVAQHADWPVNECDLLARHLWLVKEGRRRIAALESDPEFFDAKVAGWWVWGINSWIGSGWCSGTGPHTIESVGKLPHLGNAGQGVNRKLPHLGDAGRGVNGPDGVTDAGGSGQARNEWDRSLIEAGDTPVLGYFRAVLGYFRALAARLRKVRVCCGDWSRIVTDGALAFGSTVGVLLDPPYSGDVRTKNLYSSDDHDVADEVRAWAIEHGDDPRLRIVLCGYETEHEMPAGWRVVVAKNTAAYQTTARTGASEGGNQGNRRGERLWFSPHCLDRQPTLFHLPAHNLDSGGSLLR